MRWGVMRRRSVMRRLASIHKRLASNNKKSPPHRWGWGDKQWSGSQRPTSADSLQRLAIVIVIRAAKRRDREDSQMDRRRCGVEWLTKGCEVCRRNTA